ncbi:polysaccharide deacetylase family protein [Chromobacterium subtsugae]|uniref:Polysaccharide deacetylase family protein n=1 Tax=Chromobacterium subtsugae TaxID=251747 RepID=A0ABS7FGQ7_9NEIS|nr:MULTISPECIES: polysaccharide deacetylase family protein [Chromobacterium]MBW7567705.1 polysaccharide deacetylase family protein [Chromobacterium subtsugae]MBW8288931.1 polysaccharide deacetylase family protein [Chromobacterium subtsugae]WSE91276.1 polysaccharide deacetylase family protein [Chromobacterium subtsugae]WVH59651.1 polysaccharide deacetylase family protein [Chromobacterium subtsugae]
MFIKPSIIKSRLRVFLSLVLFTLAKIIPFYSKEYKGKTRVILFHHIDTQRQFEKIVKKLSEKYNLIGFDDYLAGKKNPSKLNLILAFDDGYLSWKTNAYPVLKKYCVRPLFFLNSDFVDLGIEDAHRYCENVIHTWAEPSLTWKDVQELFSYGAEIGGHCELHLDLSAISTGATAHSAIENDKVRIEKNLNHDIRSFAYPFGRYTPESVASVSKIGYQYGFTCEAGYLEDAVDPLRLPRTNIGMRPPIAICAAAEGWLEVITDIFAYIKKR